MGWIKGNPITSIIVAGLVLRLFFFDLVSVNYDTGLYLYDSMLLTEGQVPVVDYPSRSPLFHILLTPALIVGLSPISVARIMMIAVSLALGITIFFVTKNVHSRGAGIAACAIYTFSPFALIWGLWVKTEQVTQLVFLLAALPLLAQLDEDRLPFSSLVLLGLGISAAFFVRRIVVIHLLVSVTFLIFYRYFYLGKSIGSVSISVSTLILSVSLFTLSGYIIWSGGYGKVFLDTFHAHGSGFLYGTVAESSGMAQQSSTLTALMESVFNKTDFYTVVRAVTLTLSALAFTLAYLVVALRRYMSKRVLVALSLVVAISVILLSFIFAEGRINILSILTIVGICAGAFVLFATDNTINIGNIWNVKLIFPFSLALIIFAGYVIRKSRMYPTYFQDIFPYISILAGVVVFVLLSKVQFHSRRAAAWGGLILLSVTAPFLIASPLWGLVKHKNQVAPSEAVKIGRSLNDRFGDDAIGFSAQPLYSLEAGHRVANDFSRKYWTVKRRPNSDEGRRVLEHTASALNSGRVKYVVMEVRTRKILHGELEKAFRSNYCRVPASQYRSKLYEKTASSLYEYDRGAPGACNESFNSP